MRTRQRPTCRGVIEGRRQKRHCVVTVRAIGHRERRARRRVRGVRGSLPAATIVCIQVALRVSAIGRLDRQRRVIARMALIAPGDLACRRNLVRIRQWEPGARMIERGVCPCDGVMTLRTERSRETRGNVIRYASSK